MTESQWRIVFRSLFPHANDSAFVDRLYSAIVKNKQHQQITFEDLILCLWELTDSGKTSEMSNSHINSSGRAQFAFHMMDVDGKGKVDEAAFYKYTRCVFALTASHQVFDGAAIGLPAGSIYRSKSADDDLKPLSPLIARFTAKRFKVSPSFPLLSLIFAHRNSTRITTASSQCATLIESSSSCNTARFV
uniref:EF-hand domain-containing protein n=1 Tax=Caenorhabditis japonica TaxID=281687 RepID=A0A8R1E1T8_CAEJA